MLLLSSADADTEGVSEMLLICCCPMLGATSVTHRFLFPLPPQFPQLSRSRLEGGICMLPQLLLYSVMQEQARSGSGAPHLPASAGSQTAAAVKRSWCREPSLARDSSTQIPESLTVFAACSALPISFTGTEPSQRRNLCITTAVPS